MKVIVEKPEDAAVINQVCDAALKAGGMQSIQAVNMVVASLTDPPKPRKRRRRSVSKKKKRG